MKTSFLVRSLVVGVVCSALNLAGPVRGDDTVSDMLNQSFDLVHQAWNPGGDAPSVADRIDLLTKALKLAQEAPSNHLRGHRVQAIQDIQAALAILKNGDPDGKAVEPIHDAADQLQDALTISQ
jgi:hypothetical protein